MKNRFILLIFTVLFLIPIKVCAKSNVLYDVIKDEAESNGLARKYTGEHKDSFTVTGTKDIYHWYAQSDSEGTSILDKNNVIFGNYCWQMIRTTDTGGVKLIYNGDVVDGKCLNTRPYHVSYISYLTNTIYTSSYNYWYATDYIITSSGTFQLAGDKVQSVWSSNYSNLYGKYTCLSTSETATCSTLYYITGYYSSTYAKGMYYNTTGYSNIGIYYFNSSASYGLHYLGYKYNKTTSMSSISKNNFGTYSWPDSITFEENDYVDLANDTTYPFTFDLSTKKWTSNMHVDSKSAAMTFKVAEAGDYFLNYTVSSESNYDYAYFYKNSTQLDKISGVSSKTITLTGLTTSDVIKVQYQKDGSVSKNNDNVVFSFQKKEGEAVDERYLFGTSFTYSGGYYHLVNTIKSDGTNSSDFSNYHYTCFSKNDNCSSLYYILYYTSPYYYYFSLTGGQSIKDYVDDRIKADNVNSIDSIIKQKVELWYYDKLYDYDEYIEDTIFCNNRSFDSYGVFNPNGGTLGSSLYLKGYNMNANLECPNVTDQFSVSNDKAKLGYKVGLPTANELYLLNNYKARNANYTYWTMTPSYLTNNYAYFRYINSSGSIDYSRSDNYYGIRPAISLVPGIKYSSGDGSMNNPYVVKEWSYSDVASEVEHGSISINTTEDIKEDTIVTFTTTSDFGYEFDGIIITDIDDNIIDYEDTGNENEYQFVMPDKDVVIHVEYVPVKSSITIEIVNETKDITIEIDDITAVNYNEEVSFQVKPVTGYKVIGIEIIDSEGNPVEFQEMDNLYEYQFVMPAIGVTIIPTYDRVSNSVTMTPSSNAKELKIEVANAVAVVYEDTVKFVVVPDDNYEIVKIEVKDEEENDIEYTKTNLPNEYEFIMPATNVVITPYFKLMDLINPETQNPFLIVILIVCFGLFLLFLKKVHLKIK